MFHAPADVNDYFLVRNDPVRPQYYPTRHNVVRPSIVLHTAENMTDLVGEDTGAEAVASFIQYRKDNAGSYHAVVDRDSVVWLVPPQYTAFGARGYNSRHLHLAFALRAGQWNDLTIKDRADYIRNGAIAAAGMATWLEENNQAAPRDRRLTKEQVDDGEPGFVAHAELDPGRRTDPGSGFPWHQFFSFYDAAITIGDRPSIRVDLSYSYPGWRLLEGQADSKAVANLQRLLNHHYGSGLIVDGDFGPLTVEGVRNAAFAASRNGIVDEHVWECLFGRYR